MATGFGTDSWLGIASESTYGTYVAPTDFLEIMEEGIETERPLITRPSLRSPSVTNAILGKTSVSGSFKCQLGYQGFDLLYRHAMGGTPATSGAGPYQHIHALGNSLPTGLSLHLNRSAASVGVGSAFKFMGCQIQSLKFSQSPEEEAMLEVGVIGRDFGNVNVATPTFTDLELVEWTQFSLSLGGAIDDYVKVRNFEITLENVLAEDRYNLGSGLRVGLGRNGPRKVSGKFTTEFDSLAIFNVFKAQTGLAGGIALTALWDNGQASTLNRKLQLDGTITFESVSQPVKDAGVILADVSFNCLGSTGNDEFYITTTNAVASLS
jgi:hypothetical protein